MDLSNPKYKNQGIHVDAAIFSVSGGKMKILLVKRANEPEIGKWMLPGGGVYNDESIDAAMRRELREKVGIENLYLEQVYAFGDPKRDPRRRMVSVAYLALTDRDKITVWEKSAKIQGSRWLGLDEVPKLLFDHNDILDKCFARLRQRVIFSNIAANILPKEFTFPELHGLYEAVLGRKLDRRNFRKKILASGLVAKTGKRADTGRRPADLYRFRHQEMTEAEMSI